MNPKTVYHYTSKKAAEKRLNTDKYRKNKKNIFRKFFTGINGVRFKFNINATSPDFRRIIYKTEKGKPIQVLKNITIKLLNKYKKQFLLNDISRLCSFYLAKCYNIFMGKSVALRRAEHGTLATAKSNFLILPFTQNIIHYP